MEEKSSKQKIEQAEYRSKLISAELEAIKSSKAYRLSKAVGIIKAQIMSDPVGLPKKAARILLNDPKKLRHIFRTASRGAFIAQSIAEQTAKYQEWILLNEPDEAQLETQRQKSDTFKQRPLISIITPVFNPPVDVLEELIESVLEQTYANFELCLGDFGDDKEVQALIQKCADIDPRIKNMRFKDNRGIAYNSNQILKKVTGDFIALLDHDDTLSPDALYENVQLINQQEVDFIYSDKDKIDEKGNRFDPFFKPKLSPETLLNINYLTHLNVMRTKLVKEVGGWDSNTDGAQDWDLFLKLMAKTGKVAHIPKVLYHWRVIATSTAHSIETKPYALAGQRKAVDKYLQTESIPATSYHKKTELFLRWNEGAVDSNPMVFIDFSSIANLRRTVRHLKRVTNKPRFAVLVSSKLAASKQKITKNFSADVIVYGDDELAAQIGAYIKKSDIASKYKTSLVVHDKVKFSKKHNWYQDLSGWLLIQDVAAVSGRLVNRRDLIVDSGGVITPDFQYAPLFQGFPRYYQSYLGNAEWVRNLSILSSSLCATRTSLLVDFTSDPARPADSMDAYFIWLSMAKAHRLVMTPHVTATISGDREVDPPRKISAGKQMFKKGKLFQDPYSNPNMSVDDPLRLFDDEPLVGLNEPVSNEPIDKYQHDAVILAGTFDLNIAELEENMRVTTSQEELKNPKSVAWFLPAFDSVYAGLMNIFSFACYISEEKKLNTTIYILKNEKDVSTERKLIVDAFPALKNATFVSTAPNNVSHIKQHDIGIATQWATAFLLAKANRFQRKCYFIQDNEANFYPKGSISALVELTYKLGFTAIANTAGLLELYKRKYGGSGVVTKSLVKLDSYHPRQNKFYATKKPYKVFFYARPNMPRNAFELGVAGLKKLKQELGDDVEIITAGAAWEPSDYEVEGLFTNLGKVTYDAVPKLYRSVDAGLMFMFSGHPGVTASELMASGCPVVVNEYDDVTWKELYQHEKTCLVSLPTASEIARNVRRCLEEPTLRKKLIKGGLDKAADFYKGYEKSLDEACKVIISGKAS